MSPADPAQDPGVGAQAQHVKPTENASTDAKAPLDDVGDVPDPDEDDLDDLDGMREPHDDLPSICDAHNMHRHAQ